MAVELKKVTRLAWRRFLLSAEGQEGMLYAREQVPTITKGSAEDIIFAAGLAQGFKNGIDVYSEIIAVDQVKEVNAENP